MTDERQTVEKSGFKIKQKLKKQKQKTQSGKTFFSLLFYLGGSSS